MNAPVIVNYEMMNASLLSRAPAIIPWKEWRSDQDWEDMRLYCEQRLLGLRNWRTSWWVHWAEIATNMLPRRYHWLITPNQMTRGSPINQEVVDSTPTQAINVCAAGMLNGLTSPSRPWFKLGPPKWWIDRGFKMDAQSSAWFEEVEARIYAVLAGSNWYDALFQMYEDEAVFGTGPMIIYEDREDIIRCYNPCAGEYYLMSDAANRVCGIVREYVQTVLQIVNMFGSRAVAGTNVGTLWNTKGANLDTEFIVGHLIEPNFPAGQEGQNPKLGVVPGGFAYREVYWLRGIATPQPLSIRGFNEKPFIAPRWTQRSNDPYGRSPGMNALPDVRQLHQMTRRFGEAIDKMVRPPMLADVSMKNEPSSILPGRVTYVANLGPQTGMRPAYTVNPQVAEMAKVIEVIEQRVEKWFYNDVFLMISQMEGVQPRNELELTERRGEKLLQLGPVIEKNLNEAMTPAINRIASIMARRGLLPPKPAALRNVPIEIRYVSILALTQAAAATAGMERTVAMAGKMEGVWPGTIDNIDPDAYIRDYGEKLAYPSKDWRTPEIRDQMRQARAKAQQQAAQAQHLTEAAKPAADMATAAQTLSQTDTGGGLNALQLMLQGGGAGAPGAGGPG